jgi:cytochrome c oxidase subunit 2
MAARSRYVPYLRLALLLVPAVLLLSGCTTGHPFDTLTERGDVSERILGLFRLTFWIAVGVFFAVEGLLLYTIIRFRRRPGRDAMPMQTHGNTRLEIGWTIAPAVVLAVLTVPTISTIVDLSRKPENAVEVRVIAHQWWWEFRYTGPNNQEVIVANEMHIPIRRDIFATIESLDVIHSFWIPNLAGKQDAVPNHKNNLKFDARAPGLYQGQCAEFCGASHALMRFIVIAESQGEFDQWLANQAKPAPNFTTGSAARGQEVFLGNACIGCHSIAGTAAQGRTAPDLTHFGSRITLGANRLDKSDPENIVRWIQNPQQFKPGAKMPSWGEGTPGANTKLSDEDIKAIVDFLQSLK